MNKDLMGCYLLALIGVALPLLATANDRPSPQADWPQLCRQQVAQDPDPTLTFSDRPKRNPQPSWWLLRWQGLAVPVPAADYRELLLLGRQQGVIELILKAGPGYLSLFHSSADARVEGEGYSIAQAMWSAYAGQPVTCAPEQREQDSRVLQGRTLLGIAGPYRTEVAYAQVGNRAGWLESGVAGKNRQWRAITLGEAARPGLHIEVVTPDTPLHAGIGLEIGVADPRAGTAPMPAWLTALQQALDADSATAWQTLRRQLQAGGFGPRSIVGLDAFLGR